MATVEQEALSIRPGLVSDAEEINTIYNWYVTHSTITFDIEPWTTARREQWITDLQQPDTCSLQNLKVRWLVLATTPHFAPKSPTTPPLK